MNFLTGVLLKTLWEVITAKVVSLGWRVILERFITRLLVWCLEKLQAMSTNTLVDGTVDDILAELRGHRLPHAKRQTDT